MGPGPVLGLVEVLRDLPAEDVRDERRLSRTTDARHRDKASQRDLDVDVLQVVRTRASNDKTLAAARSAPRWDWNLAVAPKEGRGDRVRVLEHLLDGAGGDDLAPMLACRGPDVDH